MDSKSISDIAALLAEAADRVGSARAEVSILDDILERIPLPIIVGTGTDWVAVSTAFSDLLGWRREQLIPRYATPGEGAETWATLVHPDDYQATLDEAVRVVEEGVFSTIDNRYRQSDGSYRSLRWRWGPPGASGHTVAACEPL